MEQFATSLLRFRTRERIPWAGNMQSEGTPLGYPLLESAKGIFYTIFVP